MTIVEMIYLFDLIQDKVNSLYYTSDEKVQFINLAQDKFVKELILQNFLPSRRGGEGGSRLYSSIESNLMSSEALEPLIVADLEVSSDIDGIINRSLIKSQLNSITGDSVDYISVISLAKSSGVNKIPVKLVRTNDFYKFQNNEFKKSTTDYPQYRINRNNIKLSPTGVEDYFASVIKEPIRVVYDEITPANNVDSELPSFTHDSIVAIALNEAGVSSRDSALLQLKKISDNNLTTLA